MTTNSTTTTIGVDYRQRDTHLMASFPGQPEQASTRKVKPIWILIKQEDDWGGSGISCTVCKSLAPCSRQITTSAPYPSIFYRLDALPEPNQQCQSTEGNGVNYRILEINNSSCQTHTPLLVAICPINSGNRLTLDLEE